MKQSRFCYPQSTSLLRRFAPRNDTAEYFKSFDLQASKTYGNARNRATLASWHGIGWEAHTNWRLARVVMGFAVALPILRFMPKIPVRLC